MRRVILVALVASLLAATPAFALREIMIGNAPLGPDGFEKEVLAAFNVPERTVLSAGPSDGDYEVYFHGGPKALNDALRKFAAIKAGKHEVILVPFAATPFDLGKESYPYDWTMRISGDRPNRRVKATGLATMTVYIPNVGPPVLADPAAARKWIADLGNDNFKVREQATKELAALGTPAAALFREALKSKITPEAHDRLEKLLADVSKDIRVDVLELPAGVTFVGPDDLLARARTKLADKSPTVRGHGATDLAECGVPAEEVLPELEKMLKTESEWESHAAYGAVWGAYRLGAAAKPLLPALRTAAGSKDKDFSKACQQIIESLEKTKDDPVPADEAKKRATIRKEIRELLSVRK
ncbi:MAG TPA: hypothetical protein VHR66_21360 [Gemmataceae bacterium]|nr:hypothetical protein [Gemmataceae bacterium]